MKCLYHANCNDGIAAALAVWLANPDMDEQGDFMPVQYQQEPPWEMIDDQDVVIVDFSYKLPVLQEIAERANSLLVLDHHKSAALDLAEFRHPKAMVYFDNRRSGAVMAWHHFHNDYLPELYQYVQDRDLWEKKLPDSDAVTSWLHSWPMDLSTWKSHLNVSISAMRSEGKAIERWFKEQCRIAQKAWESAKTYADIGGYTVPVMNMPKFMSSELAGMLAENQPFAAIFFYVADGVVYSLRRRTGDIDISEIAASYGGGGHAAAAGFKIKEKLPYVQNQ